MNINFFLLVITLALVSCTSNSEKTLNIAVAANMQFAIKELSNEFTTLTGIKCNIITASSGKLTAQIQHGAPYHVFMSADMKFPNSLYNNGSTTGKPKIYAYGKLALWTTFDNISPNFRHLTKKKIKHIAIANVKTAPYGKASMQILNKIGLLDSLQQKLVFGESISQVNQFVNAKTVEVGFTSISSILSSPLNSRGYWTEIDTSLHSPIAQGIVIIKQKNTDNAIQFKDFVFSEHGKTILTKYGYLIK